MQARVKAMSNAVKCSVLKVNGLRQALSGAVRTGILAGGTLLGASQAFALGLGAIDIQSGLNEPLNANVTLLDVAGLNPEDIIITLAESGEFARAGIPQSAFLFSMRFTVELGPGGTGLVHIISNDIVTEPTLSFLLSARWPNGGLIREYNLLVDLPASPPAQAAVAENSPAGSATSSRNTLSGGTATNSAQTASRAPAAGSENTAPQSSGEAEELVVRTGDTLWEIALRTRPSNTVSPQQMMIALRDANPEAFVNNNVNRMLTGSVLRIPSQQTIAQIDAASAVSQVVNSGSFSTTQPLTGAGGAGAGSGAVRDELTILSGDQSDELAGGSSDLDATIAALENELMISEENLDRARLENRELTERLAMLEEQIDLLQNIIAIEDERLAELQTELARQAEIAARAVNEARESAAALEGAEGSVGDQVMAFVQGSIGKLIIGLGGLVVVVLALLAALNIRRKKARAELEAQELEDQMGDAEERSMSADDSDDEGYEEGKVADTLVATGTAGAAAGFLAKLKGMFRRTQDEDDFDDDDDFEDDQDFEDEGDGSAEAAAPVMAEAPAPAKPAASENSSEMLREMGLDDELSRLDAALAEVDADDTAADEADDDDEDTVASLDEALLAIDAEDAEEDLDEDLTQMAVDLMAEAPPEEEILAAASTPVEPETTDTAQENADIDAPEVVEFVSQPVTELVADVEMDEADDSEDEVFEFSLSAEPEAAATVEEEAEEEVETFSFTPAAARSGEIEEVAVTPDGQSDDEDLLEMVDFPESLSEADAEALDASIEIDETPMELDLTDLSFDDTMVADDDEEESSYEPRRGDECDTKLDLAVAYEAMGDMEGAFEILDEVIADGNTDQKEEAIRLKEKWKDS